jgi:hypothetical protein
MADDDRLEEAGRTEARLQFSEVFGFELASGLIGIRPNLGDGDGL